MKTINLLLMNIQYTNHYTWGFNLKTFDNFKLSLVTIGKIIYYLESLSVHCLFQDGVEERTVGNLKQC